jgi:hypothetical protein
MQHKHENIIRYIEAKHPELSGQDILDILFLGKQMFSMGSGALYGEVAERLNADTSAMPNIPWNLEQDYKCIDNGLFTSWTCSVQYLGDTFVGKCSTKKGARADALNKLQKKYRLK